MDKLIFSDLSLTPEILKAVSDMGFEEATPIQSLSIPSILQGIDVIGQAHTGTGKTAAFGIPILQMVDTKDKNCQAIVLCPTRELAIQVSEEMRSLSKYIKNIVILPVYGGQPIDRQIHALRRGVQVVIGTPGRVIDHLQRKTLSLHAIRMVVLDEADEMLNMGFREDIELILKNTPPSRQTVFFSATMPKVFMGLTQKYQKNPKLIKVTHGKISVPKIDQVYFEVRESSKIETLCRVIDMYDFNLSLVFCNTKRKVDELIEQLQARGYPAEGLHGDMNQSQRDRIMGRFRNGSIEILIATDVAARGIDVEDIEAVFNYDLPQDDEYYVHRIGRTGRAGKEGKAFSFVSGKDIFKLRDIQRFSKITIKRALIPSEKDIENVKITQFFDKVRETLKSKDLTKYSNMIEHLIGQEHTSLEVAGALLMMSLKQPVPVVQHQQKEKPKLFGNTGGETGMVRLFMNVGRKQNVKAGDILGAIAGETGLEGKNIGNISLHETFSFVEVPEEHAANVISIMKKRNIKGHKINIEPATKK